MSEQPAPQPSSGSEQEGASAAPAGSMNPEVFQREAVRMKLAGTRRGTTVALAGVLQGFSETPGTTSRTSPLPGSVAERVFDFTHVTSDPATRALIDSGRTIGCFYIESPGMRALFERLHCRTYEEVVAASSIIRPGVAESGMMQEYVSRHLEQTGSPTVQQLDQLPTEQAGAILAEFVSTAYGEEQARKAPRLKDQSPSPGDSVPGRAPDTQSSAASYARFSKAAKTSPGKRGREVTIHPIMQKVLPETYGVMVYQEDVLRVAHEVAGLSYSEADLLRRAMSGKSRSDDAMRRLENRFQEGARARGLSEEDAAEIWRQMSSFAGYSFCKGHSAAFAVLSYQVTYLKAHFPAEFFAAVLTNQGGFYGPAAYLEEARRWGIEVLGPCINRSEEDYTGCTTDEAARFPEKKGWLRIGLQAVLGLSSRARRTILRARAEEGPFVSLADFLERTRLGYEECRGLIKAGAMDTLGLDLSERISWETRARRRPALLLELAAAIRERELNSGGLFQPVTFSLWKKPSPTPPAEPLPSPGEASTLAELCAQESEHLGFSVTAHPMDLVRVPEGVILAKDIRMHAGKRIRMAGLGIAAKLLEARNTGRMMKMLTLEDRTDTFEAILFPRIYDKYAPRTLGCGPFLVEGKVDVSLGSPTLNVERIGVLGTEVGQ